ncbi:MAG: PorV/PorQ family protein [Candidatus Marinimicrobia bacterium]|nr:PorV/PorQ family protein [Candidatus Neomarinimicrobiota bacterium]
MKKLSILISILTLSAALFAETNAGLAGSYLRMGLGAQAIAMGNSGVALSANGFAAYYNPAGIPYLDKKHLSMTYYFLSMDRQLHYVGLAIPLKPTAGLAVSWMHGGVTDIQGRDFLGNPDEMYETGEDAFILTFANAFFPKFSAGINFKILKNTLCDITATGLGFDLGFLYKPTEHVTFGLEFKDIGASYTWNTQELFEEEGGNYTETFPQIVKCGFAIQQGNDYLVIGDLEYSDKGEIQTHFGGEYNYKKLCFFRMGMNDLTPCFGMGFAYGFIANLDTRLDYAVALGMVGEGTTHVFSWEFKF